MAGREQPYDPYIPSGSNGQQGGQYDGGNARTAAIQSVGYPHDRRFAQVVVDVVMLWQKIEDETGVPRGESDGVDSKTTTLFREVVATTSCNSSLLQIYIRRYIELL